MNGAFKLTTSGVGTVTPPVAELPADAPQAEASPEASPSDASPE